MHVLILLSIRFFVVDDLWVVCVVYYAKQKRPWNVCVLILYLNNDSHISLLSLQADFDAQLEAAGDKLVVVDFFATWCGPCKVIAPKLEEFADTYKDRIVVLKVDVDECENVTERYNITSMPTFVFIKGGVEKDSFSGANAEKLEKFILQLT